MQFSEVREKYPQYNDLSDEQLAGALHKKYYSDISYDDFSKKVGLTNPEPETSAATYIEPALTLASSVPAEVVAGLSAIWPAITGNPKEAEANINAVREIMTYQPKTPEGQAGLQAVGEAIDTKLPVVGMSVPEIGEQINNAFSESGAQAIETLRNDPKYGKIAQGLGADPAVGAGMGAALPDAMAAAFGLQAVKTAPKIAKTGVETAKKSVVPVAKKSVVPVAKKVEEVTQDISLPEPIKQLTEQSPKKQRIAAEIEAGRKQTELAKYNVDAKGKLHKDKLFSNAESQGFQAADLAALKQSTKETKKDALRMVNRMQHSKSVNSVEAMDHRPGGVAGEAFLKPVKFLIGKNKTAASNLDRVAKNLKGVNVDITPAINKFMSKLEESGIRVIDGKLDFTDSVMRNSKGAHGILNSYFKSLTKGGRAGEHVPYDGWDAHVLKRTIDQDVVYGKKGKGLKGEAQKMLKDLRHDINDILKSSSEEYKTTNEVYHKTRTALDDLQDLAGSKNDISGPRADEFLGKKLRGMTSNIQSRERLLTVVDNITELSAEYGGKFKSDPKTLLQLANALDTRFKPIADTSLGGEIARHSAGVATGERGLIGGALDIASKATSKIRSNDAKAFKALREYLSQ